MNWKRLSVDTTEEKSDLVASIMMDAGANGVEMIGGSVPDTLGDEYAPDEAAADTVRVTAYFGETGFDALLEEIKTRLGEAFSEPGLFSSDFDIDTVADTDWNENFRKSFKAFRAAGRIIVKPTWEDIAAEPGDIILEIDPGMAFGTGDHESTRLCLELLQKYMKPGAHVLDVGCGSGILGIAAMKLGAGYAQGLDQDPVSVSVAMENALNNGVAMDVRQSDLLQNAAGGPYSIVIANIVADILIRLNRDAAAYLAPGGTYILGGIIEERLDDIRASLVLNGFDLIETLAMADWRAIAARKS